MSSVRDELKDLIAWARETAPAPPDPPPPPQPDWKAIEGVLEDVVADLGRFRSDRTVTCELAADVRTQAEELRLRARRLSYAATPRRAAKRDDASGTALEQAARGVEAARDLLHGRTAKNPTATTFENELDVLGEMLLGLTERHARERRAA